MQRQSRQNENQIHVMNYCFPGIEKIECLFINSDWDLNLMKKYKLFWKGTSCFCTQRLKGGGFQCKMEDFNC